MTGAVRYGLSAVLPASFALAKAAMCFALRGAHPAAPQRIWGINVQGNARKRTNGDVASCLYG
jgi:hypothetical protein